jgi:hypothetical protein
MPRPGDRRHRLLNGRAALFVLAMAAGMAIVAALPSIRATALGNAALEDG